jgi:hypothetical protein
VGRKLAAAFAVAMRPCQNGLNPVEREAIGKRTQGDVVDGTEVVLQRHG